MILILSENAQENAKMLDDTALSKMISAIAQVLCNSHYHYIGQLVDNKINELADSKGIFNRLASPPPLSLKDLNNEWSQWARTCSANYKRLLEYARACCWEWMYRFSREAPISPIDSSEFIGFAGRTYLPKKHKHHEVIDWCEQNVPYLPENLELKEIDVGLYKEATTPFPLVMPDKYICRIGLLDDPNEIIGVDIIESYRNHYRALLKKSVRKKRNECNDCGGSGHDLKDRFVYNDARCPTCSGKGYITQAPTWSRRERPQFLGDL